MVHYFRIAVVALSLVVILVLGQSGAGQAAEPQHSPTEQAARPVQTQQHIQEEQHSPQKQYAQQAQPSQRSQTYPTQKSDGVLSYFNSLVDQFSPQKGETQKQESQQPSD